MREALSTSRGPLEADRMIWEVTAPLQVLEWFPMVNSVPQGYETLGAEPGALLHFSPPGLVPQSCQLLGGEPSGDGCFPLLGSVTQHCKLLGAEPRVGKHLLPLGSAPSRGGGEHATLSGLSAPLRQQIGGRSSAFFHPALEPSPPSSSVKVSPPSRGLGSLGKAGTRLVARPAGLMVEQQPLQPPMVSPGPGACVKPLQWARTHGTEVSCHCPALGD